MKSRSIADEYAEKLGSKLGGRKGRQVGRMLGIDVSVSQTAAADEKKERKPKLGALEADELEDDDEDEDTSFSDLMGAVRSRNGGGAERAHRHLL